jgi:hypothetical protein
MFGAPTRDESFFPFRSSVLGSFCELTLSQYQNYGNLGRNTFVGPKFFNVDSELSCSFSLHDTLAITLRLEAFNVLNHPNFNNPTANVNNAPSGFGRITGAQAP